MTSAEPSLYRRVFVGRERELERMRQAYEAAAAGQGGVLMLAGEPGIGKTALCEQLSAHAVAAGGTALVGHCYEEGSLSLPYLAFIEAIRAYTQVQEVERLRDELGSGAVDMARIVPEIQIRLGIELRATADPADDRWRLLQAVSDFLHRATASQPLLVVLEDLHWADSGTLDLLQHLARNLRDTRLLVVGTYRDLEVSRAHPLSAALAEVQRAGRFSRLALPGLNLEEVRDLHQAMRGVEAPQGLAEDVLDRTEGNPLFVAEFLRSLPYSDFDRRHSNEQTVKTRVAASMPDGLRDVLGLHLNRLSPVCTQMLTLAAVIGREFDVETLRPVLRVDEDGLVKALEEAERSAVIEERPRPGLLHYRFTHALFRQALYEEISAPRRRRYHEEIGHCLEARLATRTDEHAQELADHFANSTNAVDLAKAVHYGKLAADSAMSVFAYREAAGLLDRAIDVQNLVDPAETQTCCDLLLRLGEALVAGGDRGRVFSEIAPAALRLAQKLGDDVRAFNACRLALESLPGPTAFWLDTAAACVGDDLENRIKLNLSRSVRMFHDGRFAEHEAVLREALALARQSGQPHLVSLGAEGLLRGGFLTAVEERQLLAEITEDLQPGLGTGRRVEFQFWALTTYLQWGDRSKAEAVRRELAQTALRTGHQLALLNLKAAETIFHMLDGRLGEALKPIERLGSYPRVWRGRIAGWLGDTATIEAEIDANRDFLSEISSLGPIFQAFFLSQLGRDEGARAALAAAPDSMGGHQIQMTSPWHRSLALETAATSRNEAVAEVFLDLRLPDERMLAKPFLVLVPRQKGKAAVLLGRHDEARALFCQAIDFCAKIRHRPELALTRLDLAELLLKHFPQDQAEAGQLLDQALPELVAMGMKPWAEKALALRRGGGPGRAGSTTELSQRQQQVLDLIATGKTTKEIAEQLVLSERTVERHIADVYSKIGARNRAEATAFVLGG